MFDAVSKAEILARLKEGTESVTSNIEGSFNSDMLTANSLEFEKVYTELSLLKDAAFADTSWGEFLTMRAAEFGVIRKKAVKAIGTLTITGTDNARIPKGSLFATMNDTKFYTIADAIITGGYCTVAIEAGTAGAAGIVGHDEITQIPMSIPGVTKVTNTDSTQDGYNEESDSELLERYLLKVRTPATSGNKYHYMQWAREVPGVGNAKVFPLWAGAGTVKVIIVDSNNQTASEELIKKVVDHIEENKPIGATVTVTTAKAKNINITAVVVGSISVDEFKEKTTKYFKTLSLKLDYVARARIGKLLLECSGVEDYDNLQLNSKSENILLTIEELPTLGEVVLNVA